MTNSKISDDELSERLYDRAITFQTFRTSDRKYFTKNLCNAVKIIVFENEDIIFAPQRMMLALAIGAPWHTSNWSDFIAPVKARDVRMETLGFRRISSGHDEYETLRSEYVESCRLSGASPSAGGKIREADNRIFWVSDRFANMFYPDELNEIFSHREGTAIRVWVNRYERSVAARKKCIAHHGCHCAACGMGFEEIYGELGKGFIHVHHKYPLSRFDGGYSVDPVNDLVPLCANCHAMIHRLKDVGDVAALRQIIKTASDGLN